MHLDLDPLQSNMNPISQIHENSKQNNGHILVVSSPLQGHAAPLLKLCHHITSLGTNVTFLTTDSALARMMESSSNNWDNGMRAVSVSDGLELEDDRKDQRKLHNSFQKVLPGYLEEFLQFPTSRDKINGIIVDSPLAFLLEVPKKLGIKTAVFWCSTPGCMALGFKTPQLIEAKFIDHDGTPLKDERFQLLPSMPAMTKTEFTWYFPSDTNMQKEIFHVTKGIMHHIKTADWILCNWFHELEPSATNLTPNLLPIGTLLANGRSSGSFCPEDPTCLNWLDKQPKNSVVYAAFGSTTRLSQQQFDELANGFELMGRPFLLVAWSGLSANVPRSCLNVLKERVVGRGKIVEWAPQEAVLGHPSIACFVTHCGWSSVSESLSNGVPMLCWPYFGDQLYTQSCICDGWRVGKKLTPDESGVVRRGEIVEKVEELVCDEVIRENVVKWKEMAAKSVAKGGSSLMNLQYALKQMNC